VDSPRPIAAANSVSIILVKKKPNHTEANKMATATAKKLKIRPLDDRIVIEQSTAEEVTAGGIVLPDSAQEKPQRGKVVAAGPGKLLDSGERGAMDVQVGDQVFYAKYSGTNVEINGDEFVILRESDVLAIIG
jgi:chaperonin GroES